MKNNLKCVEILKPKVKAYQLSDEPEVIYVIKIRDNEHMIVHEDAFDLKTGNVEFLNTQELFSKYGIKYERDIEKEEVIEDGAIVDGKFKLEYLRSLPPNAIIGTGLIKNSNDSEGVFMIESRLGHYMRWVAKKGEVDDWAIYIHWAEHDVEQVLSMGDKVRERDNILKLINCDEEMLKAYRH